jgi:hypothetical protein
MSRSLAARNAQLAFLFGSAILIAFEPGRSASPFSNADSTLITASIEMKWRNVWSVAATFEGEFSSVTSSYAGKGVVRYAW